MLGENDMDDEDTEKRCVAVESRAEKAGEGTDDGAKVDLDAMLSILP